jgi:outer membrane lipoprotein-sorting protein/peroxiredoxin
MVCCNSRWLVLAVLGLFMPAFGCDRPGSPGASVANTKAASSGAVDGKSSAASGGLQTAQGVLEKMVAAYKNASTYEDFATAELWEDGNKEPLRANFRVAFERPNKLRMMFYQGEVVCDGKKWFAYSKDIPYQAVLREAPDKLNLHMLQADPRLDDVLNKGFAGASPQLLLLLEEKPLVMLLEGVRDQDLSLAEPERIGDYDCYRVRFSRNEGSGEYWIDQKTFVLRRMQYRQSVPPAAADGGQPPESVRMVVNFERARLGGAVEDPATFKVEVPDGTQCHRVLIDPGAYALVGTKAPEFKLSDMQGKPWSSLALGGKAAVIHFWKSDVMEADPMIPVIEQLHAKYKDNDKVAVLTVSLDPPSMPAKTIEEAAGRLKISGPLLRDNGTEARERLKITGVPTSILMDARGVIQDCNIGYIPISAAAFPRKLEKLLAGEDLAKQTLAEYQQQLKEVEKAIDLQFSGEVQTDTVPVQPAAMAARSGPAKLRLKPLWKCAAIRPAGNILVTQDHGGGPRIFVIEDYRTVSELSTDGKRIANYSPPIAKEEFFINLRTGVGRDGKRYFATFARVGQRFHLFDEKFNYLRSYPADALEHRHSGISDVVLDDLDGDGALKAYVGFFGTVGVQCVSLQGTRIASCRTLFNIGSVVPAAANAQGHRELYCVNDFSSVAILDAKLQLRDAVRLIADGTIHALVQADLTSSGRPTWCSIMFAPGPQLASGQFTALGLNPSGQVVWKYPLPSGTEQPVESIVVGRVLPGTSRQWVLPGADGSIHVLAADGTLIDRFNYGEQVTGVATLEIGGKPMLLISSANGVEALEVEL